ncbi:MAG: ferric reductase-like transmembrane domain-containing protein [Alphaproteobacteria bacterium]|nr:ferric reductase-like transmembrane domain-containing protein [Alphaproteobacteria bacterium]
MSVGYRPVLWNANKLWYDGALGLFVGLYLILFLRYAPGLLESPAIGGAELRMRAFGSCAFLMLTLILCIGPLARLDTRFLPLLYNRRHFGVMTFFVATAHLWAVSGWYLAFSPLDPWVALLVSNTDISFLGFPFEWLGMAALAILFAMAATSHDFWLHFLSPPIWKRLHMLVYLCYGLVVMHVSLGLLQSETSPAYPVMVGLSLLVVSGLHMMAARAEAKRDREQAAPPVGGADGDWVKAVRIDALTPDHGHTVTLPNGERAAVFRYGETGERISALSNVCAHQNGPLGEGRMVFGCVTCPWHGFQYDPETGCSPPPFTEKVPTFRVRRDGDFVMIDTKALPAGTRTPPILLSEGGA